MLLTFQKNNFFSWRFFLFCIFVYHLRLINAIKASPTVCRYAKGISLFFFINDVRNNLSNNYMNYEKHFFFSFECLASCVISALGEWLVKNRWFMTPSWRKIETFFKFDKPHLFSVKTFWRNKCAIHSWNFFSFSFKWLLFKFNLINNFH